MSDTTDALAKLHTRLIDAREGYADGRELAEQPRMAALLDALLTMHGAHADEIARVLVARGVTPENDGSFLQYVHKAVLNVRSALTGLGENVIPGLRDGERRILDLYDDTRATVNADRDLVALLDRQRTAVAPRLPNWRPWSAPQTLDRGRGRGREVSAAHRARNAGRGKSVTRSPSWRNSGTLGVRCALGSCR